MKKQKNIFAIFLVIVVLLTNLLNSCDVVKTGGENSSPCGNATYESLASDNANAMDLVKYTNFIVQGEANASWVVSAKNVCTASHSDVDLTIAVNDVSGIRFEATILYGILRERPITLTRENQGSVIYKGSDSFGIKDYYGDSPGEFDVVVTMYFPSANTHWDVDSAFVANNIISINILARYFKSQ